MSATIMLAHRSMSEWQLRTSALEVAKMRSTLDQLQYVTSLIILGLLYNEEHLSTYFLKC
jgi:hypothetical protein